MIFAASFRLISVIRFFRMDPILVCTFVGLESFRHSNFKLCDIKRILLFGFARVQISRFLALPFANELTTLINRYNRFLSFIITSTRTFKYSMVRSIIRTTTKVYQTRREIVFDGNRIENSSDNTQRSRF